MKKILFGLSIFLFLFLSLNALEKISLEQAIEDGLKMSGSYKNRFLSQKQAAIKKDQSSKNKLFNLNFNAHYLYKSETITLEFPGTEIPGLISVPGQNIEAGLHHNYDLSLALNQPLFTGGVLSRMVEMEEVREAVEANQTELEKNYLVDTIKSAFFDFQILISQKQAALSLRKALQLHCQKLENLFEEGLIKKTDLLETKTSLEQTDLNLSDLNQAIDKVRIGFHRICGHYPEEIDLKYREEEAGKEQAMEYFKNNHPVLKTLQDQKRILEIQKKIALGKHLPSINGFAELHYGKPGINFFEKKWSVYFQGGVVVNIPVFDWNKGNGEQRILDLNIQKINNQRDDFIRETEKSLDQLYSAIESLNQKKENIENMIEYSKEDAELKKGLYEEKQIPNKDYLSALQAERKYKAMKNEISLQIEKINVKINTLISRTKEYGS
ncbi:MAG: TolC family protein [Acidobacteriota bacterium]